MAILLRLAAAALCSAAPALALAPYWKNVTLPSATLSVLFAGQAPSSGARTLLFLHGFPEGSYSWWPVLASGALAQYTLVAPDLPGYNRSLAPGMPSDASYTVPVIAALMLELVGALGGRADLVAHDWGGGIAWWLAATQSPALSTLSVLNMAHPQGWMLGVRTLEAQQRASAYVLSFIQPGLADALTADNCSMLQAWFAAEAWFTGDARAALLASWRVPGSVRAALGYYRANIHPTAPLTCTTWQCFQQGVTGTFDGMPNNGTVRMPVRVLWGMRDTAFASSWQLDYMASKVEAGLLNITTYPAATHWIAQELPLVVAQAVADFVAAH